MNVETLSTESVEQSGWRMNCGIFHIRYTLNVCVYIFDGGGLAWNPHKQFSWMVQTTGHFVVYQICMA
jgi:hypothetical protein